MAVIIQSGAWASTASSLNTTSTVSVTIPALAQAGDVLLVAAVAERSEIPTVLLNNASTSLTTGRSESSANISVRFAWKRLSSADLGGTVAMVNTVARRQALGVILVRGSLDPVFTNHAFDPNATTVSAKTPGGYTPSADNSVVVSTWGLARVLTPYTGYTFTSSAPWVERVETSGSYTGGIEPTVYLTSTALGGGTANVAQSNVTVTSTTNTWDSMASTVIFAPSAGANPTARASVVQPIAEINATASTPGLGGVLSYAISPSTGISQPDPGIFLVPYTNSPQTFTITVTETGGGSSTVQATVPATPSSSSIANTTGVETVRYSSGTWI